MLGVHGKKFKNSKNIGDRIQSFSVLLLIAVTLLVYAPVSSYNFIIYDDQGYVANNINVLAGLTKQGVLWAFSDVSMGHWHPVTWFSHMIDARIYGLHPGGHHLTNLILHLLNTGLLFFVLRQMTGTFWKSVLVASLFALHPLNVESVAWVAERKNVLSTFFWLVTMIAYRFYVAHPGVFRYAAVCIVFAFGLMAKPMLVTLPFVLLLLDYWPLGRWPGTVRYQGNSDGNGSFYQLPRRNISFLFLEKIPFFLLAGISIVFTLWAASAGNALEGGGDLSWRLRIANALVSYGAYLIKMVWPAKLAVLYPYSDLIPQWKCYLAALSLAGITTFAIFQVRRFPYFFVGWFWYLGTLVPVIGLVQVGAQAMADRYAYVPLIGIFAIIAWGSDDLLGKTQKGRIVLTIALIACVVALTVRTGFQVQYWQSDQTLFSRAVAVTEKNYPAYCLLGMSLLKEHNTSAALRNFQKAVEIKSTFAPAYNNIGAALQQEGKFAEALAYYRLAADIDPDYEDAFYNLGTLLLSMGKLDESIIISRQALKRKTDSAPIYNNLGVALTRNGDEKTALLAFRQALRIKPEYAAAHYNLALVLQKQGLSAEAEMHLRKARALNTLRMETR